MAFKAQAGPGPSNRAFKDKEKPTEVRLSNITAAKGNFSYPNWWYN